MRIAVCFYGLVGGAQKKFGKDTSLNPKLSYKFYKKNVFEYLKNYDVFIHSQSFEFKEDLKKLYVPKLYCIERKKNFFFKAIFNFKFLRILFYSIIKLSQLRQRFNRGLNGYSRWYSTKKVIELKKKYERENNFKYDLVFLARLDWAFIKPFKFNKKMSNYFVVSHHNDVPSPRNNYKSKIKKNNKTFKNGLADYWFISSSKNIDKFSKLYDKIKDYHLSPHISALQHIKKLNFKLKFYKYRGLDHEALRRLLKSEE
jgi:hypothetical protein